MRLIAPADLKPLFRAAGELAPFDLREEGQFSQGHLLHARCLPLSQIEMRVRDLVPRLGTPIVVMDGGPGDGGLAERGVRVLQRLGYGDIAVLDGGVEGWAVAGYEVFTGVNVPSKAFGEFIEHSYDTPRLEPGEVARLSASGERMIVLDSRPFGEYRRMAIPGGIDMPGAELVYRAPGLVPDPETLVVVNCAGRTRSIIGAQSLINAGLPNRVVALKDGTMGWHLAGLGLARGLEEVAPAPGPDGLTKAKAAAGRVARRFGVATIDHATLDQWWAESETRTLYLLDVRGREEFAAGHLPGSRPAPGGQLVQATDEYVGVLGARIVLIDDHGVRATMTASWLIQMGWREVFVLENALDVPLATGPHHPEVPGLEAIAVPTIDPPLLERLLERDEALAVDLAGSLTYQGGHVPGAAWTLRTRLAAVADVLDGRGKVVLTSRDGRFARLAAPDAADALPGTEVLVLAGGTTAWRAAGLPLETGLTRALSKNDDVWYKPYDFEEGVEDTMRQYLAWEVDLVQQIERDGDAGFRRFD
jgi:rhodanese-related sulfurtransferase